MDTTHDQLLTTLRALPDLLEGIDATDADGPTPCTEFSVAELRTHVVQWMTAFAGGLEDSGGRCPTDPVEVQADGAAQVSALADRIEAALASPPEALYIGDDGLPLSIAMPMILGEYLVHGWDLAVATGGSWTPDEAAVEASIEFFDSALGEDQRGADKDFGPAIPAPEGASPIDRLVAVTGRDPEWQPA